MTEIIILCIKLIRNADIFYFAVFLLINILIFIYTYTYAHTIRKKSSFHVYVMTFSAYLKSDKKMKSDHYKLFPCLPI